MSVDEMRWDIDLRGQVALVTGGGRGLGRLFAQGLAAAGAAVAVTARSGEQIAETAALIGNAGGRAIAVASDVADRASVEQMVAEVERELGPVDLLVNNAGSNRAHGALWDVDPELWWRDVEINLRGPFLCTRAVLPGMLRRRRGRVINVASAAGLVPGPGTTAYQVSKTAVIRLTDSLAAETREHGIAVFAIHPGTVYTPMNEYVLRRDREYLGGAQGAIRSEAVRQRLLRFARLFEEGRDDPPQPAVRLVLALASGQADALTGRFISVRDDLAELVRRADEVERDDLYTLKLAR